MREIIMLTCRMVDTFPAFLKIWQEIQDDPLDAQIDAWLNLYMSQWPELLRKQLDDFASIDEDWRATAANRIFPTLSERLPVMQSAHDNLLKVCNDVYHQAQYTLEFDRDLVCVVYFGLGCGAGWATDYEGKPAILFGLENIAEEGWQEQDTLAGLAAHELGHLIHFDWRRQAGLIDEKDPWWQLYTEGFAQYCEGLILGKPSWHMQASVGNSWQVWCEENLGWLASEFLRRVDEGDDIRPFFGSWFDLRGYKQTGYFLGHALIQRMRAGMSMREIALLQDVSHHLRPLLVDMSYLDDR